jgi:hypothetical protein
MDRRKSRQKQRTNVAILICPLRNFKAREKWHKASTRTAEKLIDIRNQISKMQSRMLITEGRNADVFRWYYEQILTPLTISKFSFIHSINEN